MEQASFTMPKYNLGDKIMADFMSGLGGAGSGAAVGTSIAPGVGTAIGAAIGFLGGIFSGGSPDTEELMGEADKIYGRTKIEPGEMYNRAKQSGTYLDQMRGAWSMKMMEGLGLGGIGGFSKEAIPGINQGLTYQAKKTAAQYNMGLAGMEMDYARANQAAYQAAYGLASEQGYAAQQQQNAAAYGMGKGVSQAAYAMNDAGMFGGGGSINPNLTTDPVSGGLTY
jgi:hypothetical protein